MTAGVRSASARDGDEIVQCYLGGGTGATDPIRQLVGFTRVHLRAGEGRDVRFTIEPDAHLQPPLTVSVGGGQPVRGTAFVSARMGKN